MLFPLIGFRYFSLSSSTFQGAENAFHHENAYGNFVHRVRRSLGIRSIENPYRFMKSDLLRYHILKSPHDPVLKKLRSTLKTECVITDTLGWSDMVDIKQLIINLGKKLGFDVETEVPASESAWVDVVWYDNRFRFPKPSSSKTLLRVPKLPVVGFEIELASGHNPKHVKGSVANLNTLGASMGLIILGKANLDALKKRVEAHRIKTDTELWNWLLEKVKLWIYSEARPTTRIVVMTEDELVEWAKREGIVGG